MPVPVLTVSQMREWEKATWNSGKSEEDVIHNVGRLLAQRILKLTQRGDTILIFAGKGHNGDDARAAQKHLVDRQPILFDVKDPLTVITAFNNLLKQSETPRNKTWIIDALFGIGLDRPLDKNWVSLIEAINGSGMPVLSVDVPSGLNVETGAPQGAAICATITLTVGSVKKGLLMTQAASHVGRLELIQDIGLVPCPFTSDLSWTLARDFIEFPPRRPVESHKGTYGHTAIFAGSLGFHGAALLATNGALRAQPGLVSLWTQPSVYVPVASQLQSAMVHPWKGTFLPKTCTSILIGPGLAAQDVPEDFKNEMRSLWRGSVLPVVIDASALDWLRPGPIREGTLRVITPHPGEAGRMLNTTPDVIQADRVTKLRELSARFGNCIVVLKGHQTLIGRGTGDVFINSSGNPFLGQGGTGDILGGYIAGLLAQPHLQTDPLQTIRYAVWEHGATADRLSEKQRNWTSEDLVHHIGETI